MTELTNARTGRTVICKHLLESASLVALLGITAGQQTAIAAESPSIWIELDGQFSQQTSEGSSFNPQFLLHSPFDTSANSFQNGSATGWDKGLKVSFQPDGSNWIILGSIRYGRSGKSEHASHLTQHPTAAYGKYYHAYQKIDAVSNDSHAIADFQVGRDFGLGAFEHSVISLGIRYAQFRSQRTAAIKSQPTNEPIHYPYSRFYGAFSAERKFSGIGPSVSWDASLRVAGDQESTDVTFDWGVNGALLFGRQKAEGSHQTTNLYRSYTFNYIHDNVVYQNEVPIERSRSITVPNVGGFAAVSFRYSNAKIALGYRGDFFFGAIDGGIDVRRSDDRNFYGPFATVSIGLGG